MSTAASRGTPPERSDRRRWVAYAGLAVSWAAAAALAVQISDASAWTEAGALLPFVAGAVVLGVLSLWPWGRLGEGLTLDLLAMSWIGILLAGMWASHRLSDGAPLTVGFAVVIVLAIALVVRPLTVVLATTAAIAVHYLAAEQADVQLGPLESGIRYAALVVVGVLGWVLLRSLFVFVSATERRMGMMRRTEADLERQQEDLSRLYEVSRSIGAGTQLTEVLPEMVGRIAGSVGASTGLVLLYGPAEQALQVISPIWVSGRGLRAEGYSLPLSDQGLAQRVFVSSEADFLNDLGDVEDDLLRDIAAERVAAVPLRVEARSVGVLMVADKGSPFDADDLGRLESLATPAAMVIEHMTGFEEARQQSARMTELAQLKTDFVSVVSHELRTPLTSIIGSLATLARPELAPSDPAAMQLLTSAQRQADRLKRLIEDLMIASRIDQRSMPMRPELIDLPSFVRDLARGVSTADGQVSLQIADDLPQIEADPEHLRRVLTNLLDNAIKYGEGSAIEVSVDQSGSEVWMSVSDHGPGIPTELHDHIFERFTQLGPHETRIKGGTGLGLSIVRGLTEAMGGRAWYEPTLGGGATFKVAVPLVAPVVRVRPEGT